MQETRINFNTAKLAKEKGFINGTRGCFIEYKNDYINTEPKLYSDKNTKKGEFEYCKKTFLRNGELDSDEDYNYIERPTQSLLQKWLLEKHGYFVTVELAYNKWGRYSANVQKKAKDGVTAIIALDGFTIFNNPEDALEEGLFETLKLIN